MVSLTLRWPAEAKAWVMVTPKPLAPSPNSQNQTVGLPVEALASKLTVWLIPGLAGEKLHSAVMPPEAGSVMVEVLGPPQPLAGACTGLLPGLDQAIETVGPLPVRVAPAPAVQLQVPAVQLTGVPVKLYD